MGNLVPAGMPLTFLACREWVAGLSFSHGCAPGFFPPNLGGRCKNESHQNVGAEPLDSACIFKCGAILETCSIVCSSPWWLAEPPHIEDSGQPTELLLTPGAPMELLCEAQGTPQPNITWHKDGQALTRLENSSRATRVLRVESVQVLVLPPWGEAGGWGKGEGLQVPQTQWAVDKVWLKLLLCVGYEGVEVTHLSHALGNCQQGQGPG